MVIELRIDGPMDGFFGEVRPDGDGFIVWLDYIWDWAKNKDKPIEALSVAFTGTLAHEMLEFLCCEEFGMPGCKNRWTIDRFNTLKIIGGLTSDL